jgi:hypothetical protein
VDCACGLNQYVWRASHASTRVAARLTGVGVGGRGLDLDQDQDLDLRQARLGTGVKIDGGQVLLCSALYTVRYGACGI